MEIIDVPLFVHQASSREEERAKDYLHLFLESNNNKYLHNFGNIPIERRDFNRIQDKTITYKEIMEEKRLYNKRFSGNARSPSERLKGEQKIRGRLRVLIQRICKIVLRILDGDYRRNTFRVYKIEDSQQLLKPCLLVVIIPTESDLRKKMTGDSFFHKLKFLPLYVYEHKKRRNNNNNNIEYIYWKDLRRMFKNNNIGKEFRFISSRIALPVNDILKERHFHPKFVFGDINKRSKIGVLGQRNNFFTSIRGLLFCGPYPQNKFNGTMVTLKKGKKSFLVFVCHEKKKKLTLIVSRGEQFRNQEKERYQYYKSNDYSDVDHKKHNVDLKYHNDFTIRKKRFIGEL